MSFSNFNWKNFHQLGLLIKQSYLSFKEENPEQEQFNKDLELAQEEIYCTFKEYYMLPKLRKENLYLESDLNSILQTHLYDFLYDQKDLYDYYDPYFNLNNVKNKSGKRGVKSLDMNLIAPTPRNTELPFTSILIDLELTLAEFYDEKEITKFCNLRWYKSGNILNNKKEYK